MGTKRERTRRCSKVDELPQEIREKLDEMLARTGQDYLKYEEISEELAKLGYSISKSSIGRYAIRNNSVIKRLKDAQLRTQMLLEAVKENHNIEATEIATAMFVDQLVQKIATAESDIENMPIAKAAEILNKFQRSTVYTAKYKLQYNKGVDDATAKIKEALRQELQANPELLTQMLNLVERAKDQVVAQ